MSYNGPLNPTFYEAVSCDTDATHNMLLLDSKEERVDGREVRAVVF